MPRCSVRSACSVRDAKIIFQIFLYKMHTFHMNCILNTKEKLNTVTYRPWCLISLLECMNHIFMHLAITSPGLWAQIRGVILGSKIKFFVCIKMYVISPLCSVHSAKISRHIGLLQNVITRWILKITQQYFGFIHYKLYSFMSNCFGGIILAILCILRK